MGGRAARTLGDAVALMARQPHFTLTPAPIEFNKIVMNGWLPSADIHTHTTTMLIMAMAHAGCKLAGFEVEVDNGGHPLPYMGLLESAFAAWQQRAPQTLREMQRLKVLLRVNELAGADAVKLRINLQGCQQLKTLSFGYSTHPRVTRALPMLPDALPQLRHLCLIGMQAPPTAISRLASGLPRIQSVSLKSLVLEDEAELIVSLEALGMCYTLERLELQSIQLISHDAEERFVTDNCCTTSPDLNYMITTTQNSVSMTSTLEGGMRRPVRVFIEQVWHSDIVAHDICW